MRRGRGVGVRVSACWAARACLALQLACGAAAPGAAAPTEARPGAEQRPPRVPRALEGGFPKLARARLENGVSVQLIERPSLPLVELRLLIASGSASELEHPGAAQLNAAAVPGRMPAHPGSGNLAERAETLGGHWDVRVTRDALLVSLAVPRGALEAGLPLLAALAQPPRWAPGEFELLRRRELERTRALRHTSASWAASVALYAELFRATPRRHPYAHFAALPSELERLTPEDCLAWYEANVSPKNAFLLVVGDLTLAELLPLAQQALGSWQGREVAPPVFFTPPAPTRLKVLVVDRPRSLSSELRVATLVPERRAADWPPLAVASQILGGSGQSRLARTLSQLGESDPELSASLEDVAYGATPLVISARASTERSAVVLGSLLESLGSFREREPAGRELLEAVAQLGAVPLWGFATSASALDLLSQSDVLANPAGSFDQFRRDLARLTPGEVRAAAVRHLANEPVAVVAGDAARLVTPLSHFGQVHVLNPDQDFLVERVVSQDPTAPLELLPDQR